MKLIYQGAEAKLFLKDNILVKERIQKSYRINYLDIQLRKTRTKREAKILQKLQELNFPAPKIIKQDEFTIEMEFLKGEQVKNIINEKNCAQIAKEIGEKTGIMHKNDIIHGDLTTSNMMQNYGTIYFIDFGLSFISKKSEDKAVDLHLLDHAIDSKHYEVHNEFMQNFYEGYKKTNPEAHQILERLETVQKRGRYKGKKK